MTKFLLITIAVLFVLILILCITVAIQKKLYSKKINNLKAETQEQISVENKKISEILSNAKNKKDTLHSDNVSSFNSSLELLQNLTKGSGTNTSSD